MAELKLVGLHGPSRSGKDETARILVKDFGFEQRVLAAKIREILLGLDPLVATNDGTIWNLNALFKECDENWDRVKADSRETVEYMIRLGQTCRDVIGEDVWLSAVLPPVNSTAKICISDVRQPNEYHAIKERGGQVWKISRPGAEFRGMDSLLQGYAFDAHIDNRGSLLGLRGIVQATIATSMSNNQLNISHRVSL